MAGYTPVYRRFCGDVTGRKICAGLELCGEGEFVFGPLCPNRHYAIQIWANNTQKIKVCAKCHHEGKCLKGDKCDKCDCFVETNKDCKECKECKDFKDEMFETL